MRHIDNKYKGDHRNHKIVKEDFDSYNEFLKTTKARNYNDWADHMYRNEPDVKQDSWSGGISYNKATELLVQGWADKEKEIKEKCEKFDMDVNELGNFVRLDRAGFSPCVPNAVMGLPLTMFNTYEDIKKSKVVDIVYDIDYASGISPGEVITKGVELLGKIYSLEMNGYRVKLSLIANFARGYDENWYMMTLPVKNEHQPLNISRVSFALAHPAMMRTLAFDWYESLPNAKRNSGYGASVHHWEDSRDVDDYMNYFKGNNQVYVNYYSDLDYTFNDIRKQNERNFE